MLELFSSVMDINKEISAGLGIVENKEDSTGLVIWVDMAKSLLKKPDTDLQKANERKRITDGLNSGWKVNPEGLLLHPDNWPQYTKEQMQAVLRWFTHQRNATSKATLIEVWSEWVKVVQDYISAMDKQNTTKNVVSAGMKSTATTNILTLLMLAFAAIKLFPQLFKTGKFKH